MRAALCCLVQFVCESLMLNGMAVACTLMLAALTPALAQDYPTRTVTLVVPYPPGGGVDAMARIVADKLSAALGQIEVLDDLIEIDVTVLDDRLVGLFFLEFV